MCVCVCVFDCGGVQLRVFDWDRIGAQPPHPASHTKSKKEHYAATYLSLREFCPFQLYAVAGIPKKTSEMPFGSIRSKFTNFDDFDRF